MTIGRPQIEKEIDIFNEGGEVMSPEVKAYYDRVQAASERKPTSFDDISSRANELSALFPQTKQASFGDLAIALSRGLAQQASTVCGKSLCSWLMKISKEEAQNLVSYKKICLKLILNLR